jgi:hypothetical protein
LAWLLAGWLGARLEWSGDTMPHIVESELDGEILMITIGGSTGASVAVNDHRVLVNRRQAGGVAPVTIAVPHSDQAESIAAEMRTPSQDGPLREALTYLLHQME